MKAIFHIIKIGLFLFLFVVSFILLSYGARGNLAHTRNNISGYYGEKKNSLDVVIIGTSPTFSGIAPMEIWNEYGIPCYNFSTNVLFQDAYIYHIREVLKKQKPKLLILDIKPWLDGHNSSAFQNVEGHLRYNTDAFNYSKNRFDLINTVIPKGKRLNYYFDLFYYHKNLFEKPIYFFNRRKSIEKGYNNLPLQVTFTEEDRLELGNELTPLDKQQSSYFLELLDEVKEKSLKYGFDVLFIVEPYNFIEKNREYVGHVNFLKNEITKAGFDFLDMSYYYDEINLDMTFDYSLDAHHYHIYSAEKISRFLGKFIQGKYSLPNRQNDANYCQWNSDYLKWNEYKTQERLVIDSQRIEIIKNETSLEKLLDYCRSEYCISEILIPSEFTLPANNQLKEKITILFDCPNVNITSNKEAKIRNIDYIKIQIKNFSTSQIIISKTFLFSIEDNSWEQL